MIKMIGILDLYDDYKIPFVKVHLLGRSYYLRKFVVLF